MKLITSPAKLMNITRRNDALKGTSPQFIKEAEYIQSYLKERTPKYLSELMAISQKLADENWERNQKWTPKPPPDECCQALFAFTGEVYRGIDACSLDQNAINYLQKNYRILSGLYGLLRPSDLIMPYRLEMGRNFEFDHYKNLYSFWNEKITGKLNDELKTNELLLNLASTEYFKSVNRKELKAKIIDFDFYEMKGGTLKTIVVYTKHARGLMVRFCAEQNARNLDDVKAFNSEGYGIDEERSTENRLVFIR